MRYRRLYQRLIERPAEGRPALLSGQTKQMQTKGWRSSWRNKDYNAVLYEKLYSKLAIALGVSSAENGNMIGESLLSIYNPGQYLPVGLDPINNPEDDQEISQIFDTAPMFNFTYSPVNLRVSDAYRNILEYKLYPIADLTPTEKKKLADAQASYDQLAPKCDTAEAAYWLARVPYDEAEADKKNGTGPGPTPVMKAKVDTAMNKWVAAGKVKQETNLAVMKQLQGRDGSAFWDRLDKRYADNQRRAEDRSAISARHLGAQIRQLVQRRGLDKVLVRPKGHEQPIDLDQHRRRRRAQWQFRHRHVVGRGQLPRGSGVHQNRTDRADLQM